MNRRRARSSRREPIGPYEYDRLSRPDPLDPIFHRTPEQQAADLEALKEETQREKAKAEALAANGYRTTHHAESAPRGAGEAVGAILGGMSIDGVAISGEAFAGASARADAWMAERRALACWQAVYPAGAPEGFLEAPMPGAEVLRGQQACAAAGARPQCSYAHDSRVCLWERAIAIRETAARRLSSGVGTEAVDEQTLVLRNFDVQDRVPLKAYDPMRLATQWLAGAGEVKIGSGAQLHPLTGEERSRGSVRFTGREKMLVWGGNPGRGKTVAALYLIARLGGLYVLEYALAGPMDRASRELVDRVCTANGVVVIDQLQPTDPDEARRAARRLDEIVHRRAAGLSRKTLLIGNIDWATFARRYGDVEGGVVRHAGVIAERCAQSGAFVLFGGTSVRA